jgi:hypothetical protein
MSLAATQGALHVKIYLSHIQYSSRESGHARNGRMDILYSIKE